MIEFTEPEQGWEAFISLNREAAAERNRWIVEEAWRRLNGHG